LEDERRVVIIGTGPAGAAAAWALHREGIPFTVLEAGGKDSFKGLTVRAPGLTVFRKRRELVASDNPGATNGDCPKWYDDISAGGLSNHWTCAVPRYSRDDFDEGARLDEKYRWPVTYADLAPHYPEMERLLHVAGPGVDLPVLPAGNVSHAWRLGSDWQRIIEAGQARGHSVTTLSLAYGASWTVTPSGTPFNSYVRIFRLIPPSPSSQIIFDAFATRLEWSKEKRKVTRVFYRDKTTGEERSLGAGAFVVAAGTLNSTRLLLDSTSDAFPEGLGNTEGVLGRYLHDHPLGKIAVELAHPVSIHPPAYVTRAPYDAVPPLRGVSCVFWSGTPTRLKSLARATPDRSIEVGFTMFGTMRPSADDRVEVSREHRDANGASQMRLRIRFDDDTKKMLDGARDRLLEILDGAGYRPRTTLWLHEPPGNSVHFGGSVRMHRSPKLGMLDEWNRLHAASNVLVVDASCFTTGPEKNPTLTAMALAARSCQKLARDLRS
jgi:choline dehydrogenase-like flavoprotein